MSIIPGLVKTATTLVASTGAEMVAYRVIKRALPRKVKPAVKVMTTVGSLVLSSMVGDAANQYVEQQIDTVTDGFKEITKKDH